MIQLLMFFFFFQAEDGIRDYKVTGVQTCALPILNRATSSRSIWFQRSTPPPAQYAMELRCAAVRFACAVLIAASSTAYAADVSAAGAATVNCVGPLKTIIRQLPALLSRLTISSGGSASDDAMVLSQPDPASAAAHEDRQST